MSVEVVMQAVYDLCLCVSVEIVKNVRKRERGENIHRSLTVMARGGGRGQTSQLGLVALPTDQ